MTSPKTDPLNNFRNKALSRGFSRDMSGPAIMRRLEIVNDLYQFGKLLKRAKYLGKVSDLDRAAKEQKAAADYDSDRSGLESQATERLDPPAS